ncbi:MAG: S9 family peptidase [Candidatus Solibacter usitatus]|nr:S9 family peptidase [Candidatus Solibacter usitatus]
MRVTVRRACVWLIFASVLAAQKKPFDVNALLRLSRISDPQISPDGRSVAFTVQTIDVENNRRPQQIYVVSVTGGSPRKIADDASRARWSPDSRHIFFVSARSGSSQIWTMDADGANPKQVTNLASEAGGVLVSADGKLLLFTSDVYPECGADDACNKQKLDQEKASKTSARLIDSLFYRRWNKWQGARRSHLLAMPAAGGAAKDLTPGKRDVPPFSLGGPEDYAISPDSSEVCYTMISDDIEAISTNSDLYAVPTAGGASRRITVNPGADSGPQYSPDGKFIAFRSQLRAGYESDRWRLMVLERATGKLTNLTESMDRWVSGFTWSPDSARLFFTVEDRGRQSIQYLPVTGGGARVALSGDSHLDDPQFTPDGKAMVYTEQSGSRPVEIFRVASTGGVGTALTHLNDAVLEERQLTALEELWVDGAEGAKVQAFVVKPPEFDAAKKYPVLMLLHGGPQGAWGESWTYRWNAQVFAAAGYVVVMPNPRGSTGYGQKFVDEINSDWGGRVYDDVMAVCDAVAKLPYTDSTRMVAAGGSYGGYLVNWILGHTQRFKALVSHAGVYDLRSEAGATEELWFPIWEFGGMPWDNPETYTRWSPSQFAKEFKTPTLVIHGEQDFRVPYGQGLQLFTALQLQKVPSRLLLFPDEGHWIQKPQNALVWYRTFIEWIDTWTKK